MSEVVCQHTRSKINNRNMDKILEAALHCFSRKGYYRTGLREISAIVGIGCSTILYHFGSKERLAVCVVEKMQMLCEQHVLVFLTEQEVKILNHKQNAANQFNAFLQAIKQFHIHYQSEVVFILALDYQQSHLIQAAVKNYYAAWRWAINHFVQQTKYNDKDQFADYVLIQLEGAMRLKYSHRDNSHLELACQLIQQHFVTQILPI